MSYYLCESYRDVSGKACKRTVLNICELEGFSEAQIHELWKMLTEMIKTGQTVFGNSKETTELALRLYNKYRDKEKPAKTASEELAMAAEEQKEEDLRNQCWMNVDINSLRITKPRQIGAEHVCAHTAALLGIKDFLAAKGWSREERNIATLQIIARAIYPYSEHKTVFCLRENSALCEMFGIDPMKVTKDTLYKSAHHLYSVHEDMEDYLHERVCNMFSIEENVYIMDITNMYAEGQYLESELFRYGRSKEKRDDCKVVVLAAVVNTDGLLVRTRIYEGNRADVTTAADIIGSLKLDRVISMGRSLRVVMDAGFNDDDNLKWLKEHNIDYVTVMLEADLNAVKAAIEGKGTKKRDALNRRLGRLSEKYGAVFGCYDIDVTYDEMDEAAKAHLNLAVLAYWIVSVTKYKLKMKDINVRWSEILRVMSTQVRASVSMKACRKVEVTTRKDSDPEEKLMEIYNALDTTPNPRGTLISVKSVGPKIHLQKINTENQSVT